jgi:chloramphenicol O-acetyltransferase
MSTLKISLKETSQEVKKFSKDLNDGLVEFYTFCKDTIEAMERQNRKSINDMWKRNIELQGMIEKEVEHSKQLEASMKQLAIHCRQELENSAVEYQKLSANAYKRCNEQIEDVNMQRDEAQKILLDKIQAQSSMIIEQKQRIENLENEYQRSISSDTEKVRQLQKELQKEKNKSSYKEAELNAITKKYLESNQKVYHLEKQVEQLKETLVQDQVINEKWSENILSNLKSQINILGEQHKELASEMQRNARELKEVFDIDNKNGIAWKILTLCYRHSYMKEQKLIHLRNANSDLEKRLSQVLTAYNRLRSL